jgi:hypothetical protein
MQNVVVAENGTRNLERCKADNDICWAEVTDRIMYYRHWIACEQLFWFQQNKTKPALACSAGLQAAGPVVSAASEVSPIMACNTAICLNIFEMLQNQRRACGGRALVPLLKAVAGHPAPAADGAPRDPALAALAAPVPVGTALPALAFPPGGMWTHAAIMSLTHAQLDDLEWFYNTLFGGANIASRCESFLDFVGYL